MLAVLFANTYLAAMDGGEREHSARVRPDGAGLQPPVLGAERSEGEDQPPPPAAREEREDRGHNSGEQPEGERLLQTPSKLSSTEREILQSRGIFCKLPSEILLGGDCCTTTKYYNILFHDLVD